MAGAGHRAWVAGEVIEANNVQQYLMDQAVQVYNNSAARGSALIGFVAEGMVSYLKDTNSLEYFDGTNWQTLKPEIFFTGTSGQYLKSSGTAGVAWDTLNANDIATDFDSKSANYSIVAGDANSFITVTTAATVTVDDVLQPGESVNFIQAGTASITFAEGSGVTINSKNSYLRTRSQYAAASIVSAGSAVYYLVGDLKA